MDVKYKKAPEQKALEEKIETLAADYFALKKQSGVEAECKNKRNELLEKILLFFKKYNKNFFAGFADFHSNVLRDDKIDYSSAESALCIELILFLENMSGKDNAPNPLLSYLIKSMKNNLGKQLMKELRTNKSQMDMYIEIRNKLKAKGIAPNDKMLFFEMGEILGHGKDTINAAWIYGISSMTSSFEQPINEFDGGKTLGDIISDDTVENIYNKMLENEKLRHKLSIIEKCFNYRHAKQSYTTRGEEEKQYLSALITHYFAEDLLKLEEDILCEFSFIDVPLLKEIAEESRKNPPRRILQKDVAAKFGKDATDASRKLEKQFIPYLKEEIELDKQGE